MRIHILSDLHLEFDHGMFEVPEVIADVSILAGDIWLGDKGIAWASYTFTRPVVYLTGNHEYYGRDVGLTNGALAAAAAGTQVHFLDDGEAIIDGVRFLGATLWTDLSRSPTAQRMAARAMNDYRLIRMDGGSRPLTPGDTQALHERSRRFLDEALARPFAGPTVVCTHHLPSMSSVSEQYRDHPLTPAFASDLDAIIERHRPALWIHGHVHRSLDYQLGKTRVVCNPRGYFGKELNPSFDPALVVEV